MSHSDLARITYDLHEGGTPAPGDYLVSIGRRRIGSVYQITEARKMRSRHQFIVPPAGWAADLRECEVES